MGTIDEFLQEVNRNVDETLDALVPADDVKPTRLHEAMRWSLFAGGKRIRPALLFAVGETFGADAKRLSRTAAAIEMIHTYSLIHDDLPAMDDDDLRRGKATCHKKYGDATAILAGDALQTLAFKAIADDESLDAEIRVKLISVIANGAGTPGGMVAGQQSDLDAEGKTISLKEIDNIHRGKTGALISAVALSGAIIGGAANDELAAVALYSEKLGLLFQITDDLLDVTGASETLGKTAGKDAVAKKATYPGHFGVDETRKMVDKIHKDACDALTAIRKDTGLLKKLADHVANRIR